MLFGLVSLFLNSVNAICDSQQGEGKLCPNACDLFEKCDEMFGTKSTEALNALLTDERYNNKCKGTLLPPISVTSFDYLKNGALGSAYRKCVRKSCNRGLECEFKKPFICCTKRSHCRYLPRDQYFRAVLNTIRRLGGNCAAVCPMKTEEVIESIYTAAVENNATVEELINFTSIALHNIHLFKKFPAVDRNDTEIGKRCRGLLQLLHITAYRAITDLCSTNYIAEPYLLDTFSRMTIRDEFKLFLSCYNERQKWGIESFIDSVRLLRSEEAPLVNLRAAAEILAGTYVAENILEARVLDRFKIYYTLSANIFHGESVVAVVAFRN